ncbi:MAG: hypothetical protein IKZ07_00075 [Akkermansia sp.]|nr:hypothetical protein [Akkermansia sp.]
MEQKPEQERPPIEWSQSSGVEQDISCPLNRMCSLYYESTGYASPAAGVSPNRHKQLNDEPNRKSHE